MEGVWVSFGIQIYFKFCASLYNWGPLFLDEPTILYSHSLLRDLNVFIGLFEHQTVLYSESNIQASFLIHSNMVYSVRNK